MQDKPTFGSTLAQSNNSSIVLIIGMLHNISLGQITSYAMQNLPKYSRSGNSWSYSCRDNIS